MDGYFPILVDVKGKRCLVVGGGQVAERRIASLLEAKAQIVVISPAFSAQIDAWLRDGLIKGERRSYASGDNAGAFLVLAATDSPEVNDLVCRDASRCGQLINMCERPELGSFIVPSTIRRGRLLISVSTSGASPTVAASIRRQIEADYGDEYEIYLDFLSEFRLKVQELVKDTNQRHEWLRAVLRLNVLEKIRSGEFEDWKRDLLLSLQEEPDAQQLGLLS